MTTMQNLAYKVRPVDRRTLAAKNQAYLNSLRAGTPDRDLRSQILGLVFDCSGDAILVFDQDKRIVLANEKAAQISGWDLEDVSREELHRRFAFYSDQSGREVPVEDEPLECVLRERRPNLREGLVKGESLPSQGVWLRVHASPVFDGDGNIAAVISVIQDISERILVELQRDSLISLIAHDLKNHLGSEGMFLKLLQEGFGDALSQRDHFIDSLSRTNEQFLMMTDTLLELSRAQFFAAMKDQTVNLQQVLHNAVIANQTRAEQAKVKLKLEIAADVKTCRGMPAVVAQLFNNIILNAIEASPEESTMEIAAKRTESHTICVQVSDHGPGLSQDKLATLFDPKRVASHTKRTTRSTGFGLYLTSMLVESLGGSMLCTSAEGEGLTVTITLTEG